MHLRHILHSPGGGRFVAPVECYRSLDAAEAGTRRPTFAVPRTARLTWVLTPCNCVRLDGVADQ